MIYASVLEVTNNQVPVHFWVVHLKNICEKVIWSVALQQSGAFSSLSKMCLYKNLIFDYHFVTTNITT